MDAASFQFLWWFKSCSKVYSHPPICLSSLLLLGI